MRIFGKSPKLITQDRNSKAMNELRDRCFKFSTRTIRFIETLPGKRDNPELANHITRSAARFSARVITIKPGIFQEDFLEFFETAFKYADETLHWLGQLKDTLNIDGAEIKYLLKENEELSKIMAANLLAMKNKK